MSSRVDNSEPAAAATAASDSPSPPGPPARPIDWRRNLTALWVAQAMSMVAFSFVFPFFPLYIQTLGIPDPNEAAEWAGVITAATAISMAIAQPIWGNMSDRLGRKPMVVRSMIGGAVTITLMGFVQSPQQLLVLRFAQGAVTGTVAAANALAASSVPRNRLGFALGVMQVAVFAGTSAGPLVGGVIADRWGFRVPFFAAALLMALGALVVVTLVHEQFTPAPAGAQKRGTLGEMRSLLALQSLPLLATVVFMIQLGGVIISPVLSLFISDITGGQDPGTAAGLVLAATGASSAVAALAFGRIGDRIGHTRILVACLAGSAVTYFPQALVSQVWQLLVLRMLLGVALGGLMPSANALLAGLVPRERRGSVFGLTASATAMANAVGPISGALIAANLGMRMVFTVTGALYLVGCGWVIGGLRRQGIPATPRRVDVPAGAPAVGDSERVAATADDPIEGGLRGHDL